MCVVFFSSANRDDNAHWGCAAKIRQSTIVKSNIYAKQQWWCLSENLDESWAVLSMASPTERGLKEWLPGSYNSCFTTEIIPFQALTLPPFNSKGFNLIYSQFLNQIFSMNPASQSHWHLFVCFRAFLNFVSDFSDKILHVFRLSIYWKPNLTISIFSISIENFLSHGLLSISF